MCKKAMSSGAGAGAAEPPQNRPYPKPWCGDTEYIVSTCSQQDSIENLKSSEPKSNFINFKYTY